MLALLCSSIYMLHSAVMAFVSNLTSNADWTRNEWRYARVFFPVLLALSVLAHYGVEVPTIAYYSRRPPKLSWQCGSWQAQRQCLKQPAKMLVDLDGRGGPQSAPGLAV